MKMQHSHKTIDSYEMRKGQFGYRIIEYYHFNDGPVRKRTIAKRLNQSEAEDMLWKLENKRTTAQGH